MPSLYLPQAQFRPIPIKLATLIAERKAIVIPRSLVLLTYLRYDDPNNLVLYGPRNQPLMTQKTLPLAASVCCRTSQTAPMSFRNQHVKLTSLGILYIGPVKLKLGLIYNTNARINIKPVLGYHKQASLRNTAGENARYATDATLMLL